MFKLLPILIIATVLFPLTGQAKTNDGSVCILAGKTEETATFAMLFAKDQGLLKNKNIQLKILNINNRPIKPTKFYEVVYSKTKNKQETSLTKNCDFLVLSYEKILKQKQETLNQFKLLYSSYYGTNYDTHFVISKNSNIQSPKELLGKNVRLGQLGTMLAFKNMMAAEQLNPEQVMLLEDDAVKMSDDLLKNKIAMGSTYFPTMQVALASGDVKIFKKNIFSTFLKNPYPQSIILTNRQTLKNNPELISNFKVIMSDLLKTIEKSPMTFAKTLKTHTTELGMASWNVSDAIIAKGDEHYSSINFIEENNSLDFKNRMISPSEIFILTQQSLIEAKFIHNDLDLKVLF